MNKPRGYLGGKGYAVFSNMKHLEVLLLPPGYVSYPDVSLSRWKILRAKEGGKEKTGLVSIFSPSHGPLRFVTSHSRFALADVRKTKGMRRKQPGDGMLVYSNRHIQENHHTPDRLRNMLQYSQDYGKRFLRFIFSNKHLKLKD